MKLLWVTALLLMVAQRAEAQMVFGVALGTPASALPGKQAFDKNNYAVKVSQPDPEFQVYLVTAPPEIGVCRIFALGKAYEGAAAEQQVLAAFDLMRAALDKKFGRSEVLTLRKSDGDWAGQLRDDSAFHSEIGRAHV